MKLTPSKNAERMAVQYLQHEFRKMLNGIKNRTVWKSIDRELAQFVQHNGEFSFWNLVAAVSEDWKLKGVYRIISDTKFRWRKEKIPTKKIVLGSMSPTIDAYTFKKFKHDPILFKEAWAKDVKMRQTIIRTGFSSHKERDHFPIFVWKDGKGYRVFDGMRRTLLALINGKKEVVAWVGESVNKKGKPLLSGGFAYVLSQIYAEADKSDKINRATKILLTTISREKRNGKELFQERIVKWSHNNKIRELFS